MEVAHIPIELKRFENMKTLAEIESDVEWLSLEQKYLLIRYLEGQLQHVSGDTSPLSRHSVLDIAPVRLGSVLQPLTVDVDLLEEMLELRG